MVSTKSYVGMLVALFVAFIATSLPNHAAAATPSFNKCVAETIKANEGHTLIHIGDQFAANPAVGLQHHSINKGDYIGKLCQDDLLAQQQLRHNAEVAAAKAAATPVPQPTVTDPAASTSDSETPGWLNSTGALIAMGILALVAILFAAHEVWVDKKETDELKKTLRDKDAIIRSYKRTDEVNRVEYHSLELKQLDTVAELNSTKIHIRAMEVNALEVWNELKSLQRAYTRRSVIALHRLRRTRTEKQRLQAENETLRAWKARVISQAEQATGKLKAASQERSKRTKGVAQPTGCAESIALRYPLVINPVFLRSKAPGPIILEWTIESSQIMARFIIGGIAGEKFKYNPARVWYELLQQEVANPRLEAAGIHLEVGKRQERYAKRLYTMLCSALKEEPFKEDGSNWRYVLFGDLPNEQMIREAMGLQLPVSKPGDTDTARPEGASLN